MRDRTDARPTGRTGNSPGAPVLVYDTEVRAGDRWWHRGPRLTVRLDRGEPGGLTELAWRSASGAEAVIVFDDAMTAFRGQRRTADGVTREYRGTECGRRAGKGEIPVAPSHVFVTEEDRIDDGIDDRIDDGDGGAARPWAGRLRLVLDDGQGPVERVTWRTGNGTFGTVTLRPAPARNTVPVAVSAVVASDEHRDAGEVAANLLGPGPGKWLTPEDTATLDFALPAPAAVTAYRLTSANDYRDRDPRDWRLRGSADGITWYTLDSRVDQAFPRRDQSREYTVANSTAYPLYRLDIDRNWGRAPETQLNRVELLTDADPGLAGTPVPVSRIEASGEHAGAGEVAANLLRAGAGKWLVFSRTARLEFVLPAPATVTDYALTSADDHCSRDPKDWRLEGSDDGRTWVTLDRRTGETFPERFLVREFTVTDAAPYARYRLHITANAEDVGEIQLNRVQLLRKSSHPVPSYGEFSGVLRHGRGPAVGYRGSAVRPLG
ncbi:hypothetical protein SUDANB145_00133 [Streptomyces sp. enrichment culture]|uniref:coagulation factor 5/8 type domain-containing protein n=1 Tax=Streptomyces sp. enrichment culture TaxID=1795815 RepID=UPI003F573B10